MPLGAAVSVIAAGLLSTLDIGTEPVKWIVYQILAGIGFGVAIQMPMIISQSSVHPSDLASITAVMSMKLVIDRECYLSILTVTSVFPNNRGCCASIGRPGLLYQRPFG